MGTFLSPSPCSPAIQALLFLHLLFCALSLHLIPSSSSLYSFCRFHFNFLFLPWELVFVLTVSMYSQAIFLDSVFPMDQLPPLQHQSCSRIFASQLPTQPHCHVGCRVSLSEISHSNYQVIKVNCSIKPHGRTTLLQACLTQLSSFCLPDLWVGNG